MAQNYSFDITSACDLQEVDNGVNTALKELTQRYDFRGIKFEIDFRRTENKIVLAAPDEYKLGAIWEVLQTKLAKRNVPIKNLKRGKVQAATGNSVRQDVELQQGIPTDKAKEIVKFLKDQKVKKANAEIQKDQLRISSPSKDSLQEVMALLRRQDFECELQFGNYR
jgi:cyclic-di-GMP-binding protein